jgi:predicted aconitase
MSCYFGAPSHAPVFGLQPGDAAADAIPRLQFENEALREEVRQLRAAVQLYSEVATRLAARQRFTARDFHGTL